MPTASRSRSCCGSKQSGSRSLSCAPAPTCAPHSLGTRRALRRTLAVSAVPAAVFATAWLRLEDPIDRPLRSISVAGLALLPALVRPLAARAAVLIGSLVLGAWIAFELSPLHPRHLLEALGSRFSSEIGRAHV